MATMSLLAAVPHTSCSVDDERDLCCDPVEGLYMDYKYLYNGSDIFPQYIAGLDHFLFDSEGNFIEKVPPGRNLQLQELHLAPGEYTMVTVGNAGEPVSMEGHEVGGLEAFRLRVIPQADRDVLGQREFRAGELYGGFCRFTVTGAALQRFLTEMSNIHCQLDLRVEWEYVAPVGDFTFRLENVPSHYNMDYARMWTAVGYNFPLDHGLRDSYETVSAQSHQTVETTFVTLRYSNECVPVLTVIGPDGEAITPRLDLERAFQTWGWVPDRDPVQHYRIIIEIKRNGTVVLRPWLDTEVLDWVLGEIF